jgi:hypothetical protein
MHRECFFDNTITGGTQASGCNTPCTGNPTELCGGTNNILIYQDNSWVYPTVPSIETALQAYNQSLFAYLTAVQTWRSDIATFLAQNPTASAVVGRKRQSMTVTVTTIAQDAANVVRAAEQLGMRYT